jgi:hypothetical protein
MRRTLVTFLMVMGIFATTFAQEKISLQTTDVAKMELKKTSHDFGNIKEGTQATVEFHFTNTGKVPLVLNSVRASCGCTTPKWTREPVAPGETGTITAIYNSKGRPGNFTKTITVKHNGEGGTSYLTIRGFVESAPKAPSSPVQNQ